MQVRGKSGGGDVGNRTRRGQGGKPGRELAHASRWWPSRGHGISTGAEALGPPFQGRALGRRGVVWRWAATAARGLLSRVREGWRQHCCCLASLGCREQTNEVTWFGQGSTHTTRSVAPGGGCDGCPRFRRPAGLLHSPGNVTCRPALGRRRPPLNSCQAAGVTCNRGCSGHLRWRHPPARRDHWISWGGAARGHRRRPGEGGGGRSAACGDMGGVYQAAPAWVQGHTPVHTGARWAQPARPQLASTGGHGHVDKGASVMEL